MSLHIVKHVATGHILAPGPGASHWEPDDPHHRDQTVPRIFKSAVAAKAFISSWARGKARIKRGDYGFEEETELVITPVPGRAKEQLVAIPVEIKELI